MGEAPLTRPSLLLRIRDQSNHDAWRQFVEIYGPLVYRMGRQRGLQDADAADLTQVVFEAIAGQIQRLDYDPQRGTFHGWLFTVVRNQFTKLQSRRRRAAKENAAGDNVDLLDALPHEANDRELFDREYELGLFRWAAEQARREFAKASWQAFWKTAVEGQPAKEVAQSLGVSVGAIYTAKSRVLSRLKELIGELDGGDLMLPED